VIHHVADPSRITGKATETQDDHDLHAHHQEPDPEGGQESAGFLKGILPPPLYPLSSRGGQAARGGGVFKRGERKGALQGKTKPRVSQLLLSSSRNFISIT
jgi:hypothetical protein